MIPQLRPPEPTATERPEHPTYRYEVFVSYGRGDAAWVAEELLPRFQQRRIRASGEFQLGLGRPRLEEIERALRESRRTLLILTPSYLEGDWGEFGGVLSMSYGRDFGQWRTIPLVKEPCELPDRLRGLVALDLATGGAAVWERLLDALAPDRAPDKDQPEARADTLAHGGSSLIGSINVQGGRVVIIGRDQAGTIHMGDDRPAAPLGEEPVSDPKRYSISNGLDSLKRLVERSPEVRTAVAAFRARLQEASAQIAVLSHYKDLHDLLHVLQLHCYDQLIHDVRRMPADETARDDLVHHELTLQGIVSELHELVGGGVAPDDGGAINMPAWVQYLNQAHVALLAGIERSDPQPLMVAVRLIDRVLAIQPSQINSRLNEAARSLRRSDLEHAMTVVRDHLSDPGLDAEHVRQFDAGTAALARLNRSLMALVDEHDAWQAMDLELRRIDATVERDASELEFSWPTLITMATRLYGGRAEPWAESLVASGAVVGGALEAADPARARQAYRRFRRQTVDRFNRVDVTLKRQCAELRAAGRELDSLLGLLS